MLSTDTAYQLSRPYREEQARIEAQVAGTAKNFTHGHAIEHMTHDGMTISPNRFTCHLCNVVGIY